MPGTRQTVRGPSDDEGSAARRAAQDDLADRQRSARQRRRLGLQELRARDALLPLHLREPDRVPQRAGAQGRRPGLRLREPQRRRRRVRPRRRRSTRRASTSCPASCSRTSASGRATTRTSTRRSSGSSANIEGSAVGTESEDDLKGLFDDLDVNSRQARPRRSPSATRSSSSCSTRSATSTSATSPTTRSTRSATPTST